MKKKLESEVQEILEEVQTAESRCIKLLQEVKELKELEYYCSILVWTQYYYSISVILLQYLIKPYLMKRYFPFW